MFAKKNKKMKCFDQFKSLERMINMKKNNDISKLVEVFANCQNRLDEKLSTYNNTIQLVKKEIATNNK